MSSRYLQTNIIFPKHMRRTSTGGIWLCSSSSDLVVEGRADVRLTRPRQVGTGHLTFTTHSSPLSYDNFTQYNIYSNYLHPPPLIVLQVDTLLSPGCSPILAVTNLCCKCRDLKGHEMININVQLEAAPMSCTQFTVLSDIWHLDNLV